MEKKLEKLEIDIANPKSRSVDFSSNFREFTRYDIEEEEERGVHHHLLELICENNRVDLLKVYLEILANTNPNELKFPTNSYILTLPIESSCLEFYSTNNTLVFYEVVVGLIPVLEEDRLWCALTNLDSIFQRIIPRSDIDTIIKKLEDDGEENPLLERYLLELRVENVEEYAPVPEWIIPQNPLLTHNELVAKLKPVQYDTKPGTLQEDFQYTMSLYNFGDDVKEELEENFDQESLNLAKRAAGEDVLKCLSRLTEKERQEKILKTKKNNAEMLLALDDVYFSTLGPCWMQSGAFDLRADHPDICCRYGGCRSLTCYENDNINKYTGEPKILKIVKLQAFDKVNWFKGKCENPKCAKRIRKKHHAIRIPMEIGGFKGCYCSFPCAWAMIDKGWITRTEVFKMHETLYYQLGIYDRQ